MILTSVYELEVERRTWISGVSCSLMYVMMPPFFLLVWLVRTIINDEPLRL